MGRQEEEEGERGLRDGRWQRGESLESTAERGPRKERGSSEVSPFQKRELLFEVKQDEEEEDS